MKEQKSKVFYLSIGAGGIKLHPDKDKREVNVFCEERFESVTGIAVNRGRRRRMIAVSLIPYDKKRKEKKIKIGRTDTIVMIYRATKGQYSENTTFTFGVEKFKKITGLRTEPWKDSYYQIVRKRA